MNKHKIKPKILFSSPWGSYPKLSIEEDPIDYFYYRNTLKQGPFQLRIFQSWHALHFIAQNLPVESTVLENPSSRSFKSEVRKGNYQIVAISFNFLLTHNVLAMVEWLKSEFPHITIIIGGYGTALFKEDFPLGGKFKQTVDHICCGEGIEFFRKFLSEKWNINFNSHPLTQSLLPNVQSFFRSRIPMFKQMVFVKSLGCSAGCNFCATSYHFKKRALNLFSSDELFNQISREAEKYPGIKSAVIYDEDFLANPENIKAFKEGLKKNNKLRTRPLHFTVFTSIRSLQQYDIKDLIEAGIGTLYIGVESLQDEVIQVLPWSWCTDRRPVPMIAFHGTADPVSPYHGGRTWVAPELFPSIPTWTASWARRNRCAAGPVEAVVAADATRIEYTDCADDAAVVLYRVQGGGHSWPGGWPPPALLAGSTSNSIDATSLMWAFFREHPLRQTQSPAPQNGDGAQRYGP